MNTSPRRTRLQRKQLLAAAENEPPTISLSTEITGITTTTTKVTTATPLTLHQNDKLNTPKQCILTIPHRPSQTHTKLTKPAHNLLLHKQTLLQQSEPPIPKSFQKHAHALSATLVFAQAEAGTAVCIRPAGLLLTCSHCVAGSADSLDKTKTHWLLFASGQIVSAKCIAFDQRRDLALLQIIAAGTTTSPANDASPNHQFQYQFPSVPIASTAPAPNSPLVCIGHPGSEDLEAAESGVKTGYDVLHVSLGAYRGLTEGQDVHDNEEIGALQHDCWTYWGHSGAPLLDRRSGEVVGLHSSWDEETGMRRGVGGEAIWGFLEENKGGGDVFELR